MLFRSSRFAPVGREERDLVTTRYAPAGPEVEHDALIAGREFADLHPWTIWAIEAMGSVDVDGCAEQRIPFDVRLTACREPSGQHGCNEKGPESSRKRNSSVHLTVRVPTMFGCTVQTNT